MIAFPNAKINLGLDVLGKRSDGYHDILSVFYPVHGFHDVLEIIPGKGPDDQFYCSGLSIPGNVEGNLVLKAIKLIRQAHSIPALDVYLHKVIPMGAGLGGGSSDGAFALKLLNELFKLGLQNEALKELSLQLGSDCPFFIENSPKLVSGRGEVFKETSLSLEGKFLVIASSGIHISTAEAYQNVSFNNTPALMGIENLDVKNWKGQILNSFEPYALKKYPDLESLKAYLYDSGADYVSMTGSGSAIYGIFDKEPSAIVREGFNFWIGRM